MQLHQNVGFLVGNTADDIAEELEDAQTSEDRVPNSFMASENGLTTGEVTPELGTILSSQNRTVEAVDTAILSRLLAEQDGTSATTIVIDCRPYLAYSASHIINSHNVCFPSLLERRRLRRQAGSGSHVPLIPLENIVRCEEVRQAVVEGRIKRVVVYDEDTDTVQWPTDVDRSCRSTSQLITVLQSLAEYTKCELHFLRGSCTLTCHTNTVFF